MKCPKCKSEIESNSVECPRCGIIIEKYLALRANKKKPKPAIDNIDTIPCKECGRHIPKYAAMCHHCGAKFSHGIKKILTLCAVMIALSGALWVSYKSYTVKKNAAVARQAAIDEKERIETEKRQAKESELCKTNIQCWGKKHRLDATFASEKMIERMAKYQYEWTVNMFRDRLIRFKWRNKPDLTVTYIGDKIKFQNAFGAWQNMIYYVDYDPINKKVLDIRLQNGRLP